MKRFRKQIRNFSNYRRVPLHYQPFYAPYNMPKTVHGCLTILFVDIYHYPDMMGATVLGFDPSVIQEMNALSFIFMTSYS